MVTAVEVAGRDVTCQVESGVSSVVGRGSVRDKGRPGYSTGYLLDHVPEIGDLVTITTESSVRAAGDISDLTVAADLIESAPVSEWTAMGPLARQIRAVTGLPWPSETVAARAARIAADLDAPVVVQGGDEQIVRAVAADDAPDTAGQALTELADSTGGWLFDHAGTIYLQALDHRKITAVTARWDDEPGGAIWDDLDPGLTWREETDPPTGITPVELDCSMIETGLTWQATDDVVNVVSVEYGDKQQVIVEDAASIAKYGRHPVTVKTALVEAGDARELAHVTLARAARPSWALTEVRLTAADVPPVTLARLADALPGARVTIANIPAPHPTGHYPGVLEGWAESWSHSSDPDMHTITLALSHIAQSLAVPIWDAEPADAIWDDLHPADLTWEADFQ